MSVPIVELASLRSGMGVNLKAADALLVHLQQRGFVYVKTPALPQELIQRVKHIGRAFHTRHVAALNDLQRSALLAEGNSGFRGLYQYVGASGAHDPIHCFSVGCEVPRPQELREDYFRNCGHTSLNTMPASIFHANKWPAERVPPDFDPGEFKAALLDYYQRCHETSMDVLRHVSLSLGIVEADAGVSTADLADRGKDALNYFSQFHAKADCNLEVKWYPEAAAPPQSTGTDADDEAAEVTARLATHQDLSTVTLLAQDNVGGLEVWDAASGRFEAVPVIQDAILLNAGTYLEKWTDGVIKATPHRVTRRSISGGSGGGEGRLSVVFFCFPDHDALVTPLVEGGDERSFLAGDLMPN